MEKGMTKGMYRNLEAIEQREMQSEIEETVSFIIDIKGKKIWGECAE